MFKRFFTWLYSSPQKLYDLAAMTKLEQLDRLLDEAGVTNFSAKELTWLPKALPDPKSEVPEGQFQRNLIAAAIVAQEIRTKLNAPLTVSSAYRPRWYNTAVGGASNSAHLRAAAIDLNARTLDEARHMKDIADEIWERHGFAGLGFYRKAPRRIHIDVIHPDGKGHRRWLK